MEENEGEVKVASSRRRKCQLLSLLLSGGGGAVLLVTVATACAVGLGGSTDNLGMVLG